MAVTSIPLGSRIQLRLRTGFTQDGKPILRTRSYANLKSAASDEDLYQTGLEMARPAAACTGNNPAGR
jgi:hypothetical protein